MHKTEYNHSDLETLKRHLSEPQNIAILGHVSPDGDALGSSLALAQILKKQGHHPQVIYPNAFAPSFSFLSGIENAIVAKDDNERAVQAIAEADTIFLMDFNECKRVEQLEPTLTSAKGYKIMIDHHLHPDSTIDLCFSYPEKAATCLLLFELLQALGWEKYLDKSVCECLFTGLTTDTGGFSYNSEDPNLYTALSMLLEYGIEKDAITSKITRNFSIDKVKLSAHLLNNKLTFYPEYHTAIIAMSKSDKTLYKYEVGDTEGLVNEPLAAKDIRFSIFLHEQAKYTKISLRSKGSFPVNEFAQRFFNGGGHHNAAGAEVYASLSDTYDMIFDAVKIMHPSGDEE